MIGRLGSAARQKLSFWQTQHNGGWPAAKEFSLKFSPAHPQSSHATIREFHYPTFSLLCKIQVLLRLSYFCQFG